MIIKLKFNSNQQKKQIRDLSKIYQHNKALKLIKTTQLTIINNTMKMKMQSIMRREIQEILNLSMQKLILLMMKMMKWMEPIIWQKVFIQNIIYKTSTLVV